MRTTLSLLLLILSCSVYCQTNQQKGCPVVEPSSFLIERYKVDYEVTGLTSIDELITDGLDLEQYEYLRTESTDVTIFDLTTEQTIVLYSWSKVSEKKLANLNKKIKGKAGTIEIEDL